MSDFDKAVADSKKLTSKPSNEDLLELYGTSLNILPLPVTPRDNVWKTRPVNHYLPRVGLFKVASGDDFDSAPSLGMFDLKVCCAVPFAPLAKRL